MPSHRGLRIAEAVREVVAQAVLFEVADPRVSGVTVLRVEITGDMRNATVFVSVMGNETDKRLAMSGLKSATGFLQSRVAKRLQIRFTPILVFKLDESVKKSVEMSRLIDTALASDRARDEPGAEEAASASEKPEDSTDEAEDEDEDDDDVPGHPAR